MNHISHGKNIFKRIWDVIKFKRNEKYLKVLFANLFQDKGNLTMSFILLDELVNNLHNHRKVFHWLGRN